MADKKIRVSKLHLEQALSGIMGMFPWGRAKMQGIVEDDWLDHYSRLDALYCRLINGDFADRVFFDDKEEDPVYRKDYEKIAASLAKSWVAHSSDEMSRLAISNVINSLCDTFEGDNPNFRREMFISRVKYLIAESQRD